MRPGQEIVAFPATGRAYAETRLVGPGDSHPTGRARIDAVADWVQQVAYADVLDAGLAEASIWVVRRTRLRVTRFPRFGETVTLRTACSGVGVLCAERRTELRGDAGAEVQAAAVWVALDPATLHPAKSPGFLEVYGPSADDRRIRARLHHPPPPADVPSREWHYRAADLDIAGHVNNAAYWQALEEGLTGAGPEATLDVEVEHHTPAAPGPATLLSAGGGLWVVDPAGVVNASFVLGREGLGSGGGPRGAGRGTVDGVAR